MICNVCDNENGFSEEEDGYLYCKLCCSRVEGIIKIVLDGEDLVEEILEKQDESKMVVPSRSAILDMLPADLRMRLKKEVTMTITTEYARMCLDDERFKLVLETKPVSFLRLSDCSGEISLFWRTGGLPASYILSNTSRETLRVATGFIRDQKEPGIGWVYTSTDLVSASRVLQGCDKEFTPLCAHYLSQHAYPTAVRNPLVHKDEGHCCHGGSAELALSYIQKHGVPKEKPKCKIFDCFEHEELFFVKDIFRYHTIKQALVRLQTHPVAATLMLYEGWDDWNLIYRGPTKKGAKLLPPLEVLIIDCIKIDGEMVAVCKSIYGRDMGYGGNIYVSLEVMFIMAGATRKAGKKNMCFIEPQHLLFNFYSVNVEETGPYSPRMREDPIQVEQNSFFKVDLDIKDFLL